MKRIGVFTIACAVALALLCGCSEPEQSGEKPGDSNNRNARGEVHELLTVEELVDFHLNGEKYPDGFVFEELDGYGRVLGSASSREEALKIAAGHFTNSSNTTVECRLEVETQLFYGLYVKWEHHGSSYDYDEYVVSFKKDVYDADGKQFFTRDADEIKSVIDYIYYSWTYQTGGSKVYSSEITLKGDYYEYEAYSLRVVYGDWGLQDELLFGRTDIRVDFATGEATYRHETVGTVYIDGVGTYYEVS